MRVFIAIDFKESVLEQIKCFQDDFRKKLDVDKKDIKWVEPQNLHLTLKFIGYVKDQNCVNICRVVENVCGRYEQFELDVEKVGTFGGKSARVLWVGVKNESGVLGKLQNELEAALAELGYQPEAREFTGHLTLARVKNYEAGRKAIELAEEYKNMEFGRTRIDEVKIFESTLTKVGPVYNVLAKYVLK
ncbi:MAG: RNA 2',3'-cyclic phosphodiesterase [Phycisphaerae bacterium]|nr:RNA 2',3'-cyclic phosphodiesterase [Phycisphaerae bacterium]